VKYTLLDLTQSILSSMDSDEVNTISETTESLQVANIVRTCYNDIISRANLPEHFDLVELNASLDPLKPTVMYRPAGLQNLIWVKYDKKIHGAETTDYRVVNYLEPQEFIERCLSYSNQDQGDVVTFTLATSNSSVIELNCLNNKAPDFYTCWDDNLILFDSYDVSVDSTLQKNKTMVYGEYEPVFLLEDTFTPKLDSRQFSLLLNEAKAMAFAELKQTEHARAERNAKRGWVTLAHQKNAIPANYPYMKTLPNYGRKPK